MPNITCTVDGCDRKFLARGLCAGHYSRWSKDGDTFDRSALQPRLPRGTPCSVESCTRHAFAKGFCNPHWQRIQTHGTVGDKPLARRSKQGQTLRQRFDVYGHAAPTVRGCIEWEGPLTDHGYGRVRFSGESLPASRVAWELAFGALLPNMVVRHKCDNPPCVNVRHLVPGTQADNINDMVTRDRDLRGSRSPLAKVTEQDVLEMRAMVADGIPQRVAAAKFGLTPSHVSAIIKREYWKHI